jgi:hypothetical protein
MTQNEQLKFAAKDSGRLHHMFYFGREAIQTGNEDSVDVRRNLINALDKQLIMGIMGGWSQ